jgi:hypothetical protein
MCPVPPWWSAGTPPGRVSPRTCGWGRTSTSSGGWARPAGGCATSPRLSWATSTGSGLARGSPGGRTTAPPRPPLSCGIPARSVRSTRRRGPRRPGWPRRSATRRPGPWSPGQAPPCSPGGWPRSPARAGPARSARPPGGSRPGRPPAGPSRRPGRWAARSPAPGGRPCFRPRSRCAGCGCRWPRWCSCRRCWTGSTAGRRSTRPDTWPPGSSTTPGTAWGSGRDARNAGPFGPCCPWCAAAAYLGRPRPKSAGTMTSSGESSRMEDRPSASSVESMPPRSTSKTFFTPAEPLAASPHR